jgi:hypothetical protein
MRIAICSLIVDDAAARAAERLVRSLRWFGGAASRVTGGWTPARATAMRRGRERPR